MTKKEFRQLERICKDGWTNLSRTGSDDKPEHYFIGYRNDCPACEIAKRTQIAFGSHRLDILCQYCPAIEWRIAALKEIEDESIEMGQAACQDHGQYGKWLNAKDIQGRKKAAKIIATQTPWEWMEEYSLVIIEPELLEGRS
jgi:hypothetical protein